MNFAKREFRPKSDNALLFWTFIFVIYYAFSRYMHNSRLLQCLSLGAVFVTSVKISVNGGENFINEVGNSYPIGYDLRK